MNSTIKLFNKDKIILDLCGGTGAWSQPYLKAGYDVRIVTLPDTNVIDFIPPKDIYGILAAPPCTEFSSALNGHPKRARDFKKGMQTVNACVRICWQCDPTFFVLENPSGLLSRFLGPPKYRFDPWWFGDPWTKYTALWGTFNNPKRKYWKIRDVLTEDQIIRCRENRKPQDMGTQKEKNIKRAITPPGFAVAFFEANQ